MTSNEIFLLAIVGILTADVHTEHLLYIYIYWFIKKLPLYDEGAYHQGSSSGASIIINYTKCIKYKTICTTKQANDSLDESSWYEM